MFYDLAGMPQSWAQDCGWILRENLLKYPKRAKGNAHGLYGLVIQATFIQICQSILEQTQGPQDYRLEERT
jgi:hypothetical protein